MALNVDGFNRDAERRAIIVYKSGGVPIILGVKFESFWVMPVFDDYLCCELNHVPTDSLTV
jgi:hypothetical protein